MNATNPCDLFCELNFSHRKKEMSSRATPIVYVKELLNTNIRF